MLPDLIQQTYTIALPIVLGYVVWLLQQQRKERTEDKDKREKERQEDKRKQDERLKEEARLREANSKGTMLLLRVQLIEYHDKYMKKGSIPSYAYENFNEMYSAYHALGGNGMITHMKEEIEQLRFNNIKEEEIS